MIVWITATNGWVIFEIGFSDRLVSLTASGKFVFFQKDSDAKDSISVRN